jgi:two-component system CheB/CheR fusion protein
MHLLQHQGGINFREYKPATVMRRIERRMQVRHVPDLDNYARCSTATAPNSTPCAASC